ncbi:PH domain-containing protein [Mycobacterium sp. SMC-8]|uniref:PH domain-containing protein n=1 Tax=Mycobacterium sp. SMC-8 TaxID=2857060 RepID=UPI0021B20E6E|nr:PH domain-containing protein [Mycobacterium sp. SMC-8]UXA10035.1 PH domain-containing protein [Mycobacterium sp. SMC-8]
MRTPPASEKAPVVIRISPMAHVAIGFLTVAMLAVVFAGPAWFILFFLIPLTLSIVVMRYRTVADRDTVTARTMLHSRTVRWDDIDGLRFGRTAWAVAHKRDGTELSLPAVTFSTLPLLTAASGGRVPNPYE